MGVLAAQPVPLVCRSKVDTGGEAERRKTTNHVSKLLLTLPWPRTLQQEEEERLMMFAALSPFTEGTRLSFISLH